MTLTKTLAHLRRKKYKINQNRTKALHFLALSIQSMKNAVLYSGERHKLTTTTTTTKEFLMALDFRRIVKGCNKDT
jgi:hypothetical protein